MTSKGTILIVDDTPAYLKLLANILTADGYAVLPAGSGELALAAVAARPPELILLDVRLPGLDGFEVCRRLKEHEESRDIPVLFISASGESAERVQGLRLGAVDFIAKPFQREELLARVQTHLELRRLRVRFDREAEGLRQANERLQTELAERKQAEERLQESEKRLHAITDSAQDAILMMDPEGKVTYWNPAAERILGYTSAEALGQNLHGLIAPARFHPAHHAAYLAFLQTGQGAALGKTVDLEARRKDGREISVQLSLSAVQMNGGWHAVGVIRDTTESKRAEVEIQRQADFPRFNPNPVLELSAAGEINYFNGAAGEMARAVGLDNPTQMLPLESVAIIRACLATGKPKLRVETQIDRRVISWSFFPVPHNNTVHCYAGDITERKRAEEGLRVQSAALEAAANAIVIADHTGTIQWVNRAFTALTGYPAQEAVGQNPRILKGGQQDEAFYRNLWQTISSGQVWSGALTNRRKDGSLYAEEMTITPLRNADGVIARYIAIKQDITERQRTAEALRQSEAQFRTIFELASVGIAQADPLTAQWLRVNQKMCEITGYSVDELLQMRVPDITYPEDRQLDREAFERVVRGEAPSYRMEKRYTRKDGTLAWVNVNMTVIRDAAGQPTRTVAAIEDITERKRVEGELRRTSEILLRTSELAKVGGWELDLRTMKLFWALETCRIHEVDPPVAPALDQAIHFYAPEARPVIRAAVQAGIDSGTPFDLDLPLTTAKGRPLWVRAQGSAVMEDGTAVKLLGVFQDITERKQAEEVLRQRVKLQDQLVRTAATVPGLIYSLLLLPDGSTRIPFASGAFSDIFDLQPKDVIEDAAPFFSLIHPGDIGHVRATIAESARTLNPWSDAFRVCRTRLGEIWVEGHSVPQREPDGSILWHGFIHDITERKRGQAELENLHKQLVQASRRAGMAEIATNVLHNVGNVLNSVNISSGLIVESVKKSRVSSLARVVGLLQEHAHDLGEFITNDSRGKHLPAHLAQLSEHLLAEQATNLRELESLRRNIEHIKEIVAMQQNHATFGGVKEIINVVDLVEDSLRVTEGGLRRHGVEVIREFETVPPLNVEKHKVLQILVNLLRNAKHACQDAERADKRLTVRVGHGEDRLKIAVTDNGVGIPPENLTRIFHYGFTTRKGGHGFGLHSGALAAQEMGGSLTVHSDGPGQGATFTLELPCLPREDSHE